MRARAGTIRALCRTGHSPWTRRAASLHYGQAIFDGMKAFRGKDGRVRLFRLPDHARRLNRSAHYLCIPELDPEIVEESIRALVEVDQRWVPSLAGTSLYIRPTVIATETFLGVHPSSSYLYYVILGPVGAYYKEGMNPVRILASDQHVRAVQGGLGAAKTAGQLCREPVRRRGSAQGRLYPGAVAGRCRNTATSTRSAP